MVRAVLGADTPMAKVPPDTPPQRQPFALLLRAAHAVMVTDRSVTARGRAACQARARALCDESSSGRIV